MRLARQFTFILALLLFCSCLKEPQGPLAFVSNERDGTITVINTATDKVVQTIHLGARPREAIFSHGGSQAYLTAENGGTVSVVETRNQTVVDTIRFPHTEPQVKPKGAVVSSPEKKCCTQRQQQAVLRF